jgi:hypothetical protein
MLTTLIGTAGADVVVWGRDDKDNIITRVIQVKHSDGNTVDGLPRDNNDNRTIMKAYNNVTKRLELVTDTIGM